MGFLVERRDSPVWTRWSTFLATMRISPALGLPVRSMGARGGVALAAASALGLGMPAAGQEVLVPRRGDVVRVEVETPGYGLRTVIGELDQWTAEEIRVMGRRPFQITDVEGFWVPAGPIDAIREGAIIGLVGGAMLGTLAGVASRDTSCGDTAKCPIAVGVLSGFTVAAFGLLIGAVIRREDWRPVDLAGEGS